MAFSENIKLEVKERAAFKCCRCQVIGVEVHHILPQSEGGSDKVDNAAPLCAKCHDDFGANPVKRKEITYMRDWWYKQVSAQYAMSDPRILSIERKLDDLLNALKSPAQPMTAIKSAAHEYLELYLEGMNMQNVQKVVSAVVNMEEPQLNKKAFRRWSEANIELAFKYGLTYGQQTPQKVWEQFFEKGRIILSVINDWTLVFYGEQRTFKKLRNPEAIITGGAHNETVNDTYLNELLQRVTDKEDRDIYQELSRTRKVVGGIGTIYIRDDLHSYLGKPLGAEFRSEDVLRVEGNGAELLIGVPHQNGSSFKAVLLLVQEGARFSKFEWQGS